MDLLKKLVRIKYNYDENIPEIHLIKNEIKHYYDPIKKKNISKKIICFSFFGYIYTNDVFFDKNYKISHLLII